MILLGNICVGIAGVLGSIIWIFYILLFARVVLSWVSPDPRNPIVQFIYNTTEPLLAKIRSKIPPLGMFDLSPIVVFLFLYLINAVLVSSLQDYGYKWRQAGMSAEHRGVVSEGSGSW